MEIYILDLLMETTLLICKAIDNPLEANVKLDESSEIPLVDISNLLAG